MHNNANLLLVRPNPEPYESWRGYILRLAEENSITKPRAILRLANINEKSLRTSIPDIKHLVAITGKSEDLLGTIYPREVDTQHLQFFSHKVRKQHIRINSPAICTECVRSNGYAQASWDVELMNVCSIHRKSLITHCPSCKNKLSWYRKGLLTCQCGHNFSEAVGPSASKNEVAFASCLASIVEQTPNTLLDNPIPSEFANMGLNTFLATVNTLGVRIVISKNAYEGLRRFGSKEAYREAVDLLNNWDAGFRDLNRPVCTRHFRAC